MHWASTTIGLALAAMILSVIAVTATERLWRFIAKCILIVTVIAILIVVTSGESKIARLFY